MRNVNHLSGYFGADCKDLGLGPAPPPSTSSGTPKTGTEEHQDDTKGHSYKIANIKQICRVIHKIGHSLALIHLSR